LLAAGAGVWGHHVLPSQPSQMATEPQAATTLVRKDLQSDPLPPGAGRGAVELRDQVVGDALNVGADGC